jgi:hypothetical protein
MEMKLKRAQLCPRWRMGNRSRVLVGILTRFSVSPCFSSEGGNCRCWTCWLCTRTSGRCGLETWLRTGPYRSRAGTNQGHS